jgi:integrase
MTTHDDKPNTLADVLAIVIAADLPRGRRRDMVSAISRFCEMSGSTPAGLPAQAQALRTELQKIRPAAFGISAKTFSTLRSAQAAALQLAGVLDKMPRGLARQHPIWGHLLQPIGPDRRLADGLACFANWCAASEIAPDAVSDETVQQFSIWLETRTHHPKPKDLVRRVPLLWNEAGRKIEGWPKSTLARLSFRAPRKRLAWKDLCDAFRRDAEAYLAGRADPDIFDESTAAPRRPLAPKTLRQHREHLRLAASVLVEAGVNVADITSLAHLVEPERFKTVLRHYHGQRKGGPSSFAVCLAKTLVQVAKYHVGASADHVAQLKSLAAKLPPIPFDLTPKNKALLRQLEAPRLRAKLLYLPEELLAKVAAALETPHLPFVEAQVAIAIDILLAVPLRPENLSSLHWRRHVMEPDGPRGRLLLHFPAEETKTERADLTVEVPLDVAQRLRCYRRHILPRLNADPNGFLFVTEKGSHKAQETLAQQITEVIAEHVGIHMTPHQFRHFAATQYLEANPEDHQTVQAMLHHAWSKTTLIYAGSASRRASRAYGDFLFKQREQLKLIRPSKNIRSRS